MNLILRLLRVFVAALFKPRIGLFEISEVPFRVLPTDLDINLHMNNARYLSIMDLGRTDLLIGVGLLGPVKRERWMPVVGSIDIKYRRPLRLFQHYVLKTRLLCWDDKWFYMEQRLESARGVHSIANVRGLFVTREGSVPTRSVLDHMGYEGESPPFPRKLRPLPAREEADASLCSTG
ncbi:MAG: thioesterase family protein [Candidatus Thiodiazotropha sp.]